MKDFFSFSVFVFRSDRRIVTFLALSVMATILQYLSLAMMFVFLKIMTSGLAEMFEENNLGALGCYLQGLNPFLINILVLVLLAIFYLGYALFSFLSKKCSMIIIKDHKEKITIELKDANALDGKDNKILLNKYLDIYRRSFQTLSPLSILIGGLIFVSFINFYISFVVILSLIIVVYFFKKLFNNRAEENKNFAKEYFINRRKLVAQSISVLFFVGILLSASVIDLTVDAIVILIVVGRIILGSVANFLHPIFEILVNVNMFTEIMEIIEVREQD